MNGSNGSALSLSKLTYTTRCRLPKADGTPCGFTLTDHSLEIIGQPNARTQQYIQELGKHLAKKHPQEFQFGSLTAQKFVEYMIVSAFQTEDPAVQNAKKQTEMLSRRTLGPPITDDQIEQFVGAMSMTLEDPRRADVLMGLKKMRDYYEGTLQPSPTPQNIVKSA